MGDRAQADFTSDKADKLDAEAKKLKDRGAKIEDVEKAYEEAGNKHERAAELYAENGFSAEAAQEYKAASDDYLEVAKLNEKAPRPEKLEIEKWVDRAIQALLDADANSKHGSYKPDARHLAEKYKDKGYTLGFDPAHM